MQYDEQSAVGRLLELVTVKLEGDDRTAFNQLVYALVQTEQLDCARMLDKSLTEEYLQAGGFTHL